MNKIEKIRQEVGRMMELNNASMESTKKISRINAAGYYEALVDVENFLDTLSEEPDKSLEEEAEEYIKNGRYLPEAWVVRPAFIAGAEWQKEQDDKETADLLTIAHLQGMEQMKRQLLQGSPMPEDTVLFNKGVAEGRRLEKEDMLKDAVEGEVYLYYSYKRKSTAILVDIPIEDLGDKVRIIIVKDESK